MSTNDFIQLVFDIKETCRYKYGIWLRKTSEKILHTIHSNIHCFPRRNLRRRNKYSKAPDQRKKNTRKEEKKKKKSPIGRGKKSHSKASYQEK